MQRAAHSLSIPFSSQIQLDFHFVQKNSAKTPIRFIFFYRFVNSTRFIQFHIFLCLIDYFKKKLLQTEWMIFE